MSRYRGESQGADGSSLSAWGLYSFSDVFAAGFMIETDDDVTGYGAGGRFYFGK